MKYHLFLFPVLMCAITSAWTVRAQEPAPSADDVVARMLAHDDMREAASGGYTGEREYVLENRKFHKRAEMLVSVNCTKNGVKHFEVVSERGWKGANKHVLRQMIHTESESSHPDERPKSRITSDNYNFRMVETSPIDGRTAYVIQAIPRRRDKSLFRGQIWVDAEDYALVRVEGEPAENPSFWTRKIHFLQQYRKTGEFWFPLRTTSVTEAWIFGTTDVNIRYFDYKPASDMPDSSPDFSMMEAQYAKR
jgi:hypothetical protein